MRRFNSYFCKKEIHFLNLGLKKRGELRDLSPREIGVKLKKDE